MDGNKCPFSQKLICEVRHWHGLKKSHSKGVLMEGLSQHSALTLGNVCTKCCSKAKNIPFFSPLFLNRSHTAVSNLGKNTCAENEEGRLHAFGVKKSVKKSLVCCSVLS